MTARQSNSPWYHILALCKWLGRTAGNNPRAAQWMATGLLSALLGGGTAFGILRSGNTAPSRAVEGRQWLVDSFPVYLRPTIRMVVQEENAPVSAKLDTMEEKNLEVRRFIVSTEQYRRWKILRDRRRQEEERINSEAERGFGPEPYAPVGEPAAKEPAHHPGRRR